MVVGVTVKAAVVPWGAPATAAGLPSPVPLYDSTCFAPLASVPVRVHWTRPVSAVAMASTTSFGSCSPAATVDSARFQCQLPTNAGAWASAGVAAAAQTRQATAIVRFGSGRMIPRIGGFGYQAVRRGPSVRSRRGGGGRPAPSGLASVARDTFIGTVVNLPASFHPAVAAWFAER